MDDKSRLVEINLPWPPSVNHYWGIHGKRHFIMAKGKKYREDVHLQTHNVTSRFTNKERLSVSIIAYPPDRRKRDLDNILKSLLDALQYAGVYSDDSQIDKLSIERNTPLNARVMVTISEHNYQGTSSSTTPGL